MAQEAFEFKEENHFLGFTNPSKDMKLNIGGIAQQTAVEWFEQNISKYIHYKYDEAYEQHKEVTEIFEQAKQMEKEQIIDAYSLGYGIGYDDAKFNTVESNEAEQYYNETFTSTQQNENPSAT